ncbi:NAD(P)-bd_dom domain-containing protein [Pycnococcus provasolii]
MLNLAVTNKRPSSSPSPSPSRRSRSLHGCCGSRSVVVNSSSKSFIDGILDDLQAKRKLKKWYGYKDPEDDPMGYGDDYDDGFDDDDELDEGPRPPAVMVLEADTPTGEAVVLQLLLLGRRVVAVANDVQYMARAGLITGADVEVLNAETAMASAKSLAKALAQCDGVIIPGRPGNVADAIANVWEQRADAEDEPGLRIITLASVEKLNESEEQNAKLFASLAGVVGAGDGGEDVRLRSPTRENELSQALSAAGGGKDAKRMCFVIRVRTPLYDAMGGQTPLCIGGDGEYPTRSGKMSRVDAARVLAVASTKYPPSSSTSTLGAIVVEAGPSPSSAPSGSYADWWAEGL